MGRVPLHLQRARAGVAWCFFLDGFVFASWVGHIPAVKAAQGLDDAQLGLLLLCLSAGAVVAFPVAGWLVARLGSRGVTAAAALALCVTLPVPVLSPMLAGTVAGLLAFGDWPNSIPLLFAAAGNVPGMPACVGLAAVATTGYCGYLAGPPAVGFVAERLGCPRPDLGRMQLLTRVEREDDAQRRETKPHCAVKPPSTVMD